MYKVPEMVDTVGSPWCENLGDATVRFWQATHTGCDTWLKAARRRRPLRGTVHNCRVSLAGWELGDPFVMDLGTSSPTFWLDYSGGRISLLTSSRGSSTPVPRSSTSSSLSHYLGLLLLQDQCCWRAGLADVRADAA